MDTLVITGDKFSGSYFEFEKRVLYHTCFDRYAQIAIYESNRLILDWAQIMAIKYKKSVLILKNTEDEYLLAKNPSTGFISIGCYIPLDNSSLPLEA